MRLKKDGEGYILETGKGTITAKYIINAAGVYADRFHNMVSTVKYISPRGRRLLPAG